MADVMTAKPTLKTEEMPSSIQAIVKEYDGSLSDADMHNLMATSPSARCEALRMLYQGCQPGHIIKYLLSMATTPDLTRKERREAAALVRRGSGDAPDTNAEPRKNTVTTPPPVVVRSPSGKKRKTSLAAPPPAATTSSSATKRTTAAAATKGSKVNKKGNDKSATSAVAGGVDELGLIGDGLGLVLQRTNSSTADAGTSASAVVRKPAGKKQTKQPQRAVPIHTMIAVPSSSSSDNGADDEGPYLGGGGVGATPTSSHRVCAAVEENDEDVTDARPHASMAKPRAKKTSRITATESTLLSSPTVPMAALEEVSVRRTRATPVPPSNTARAIRFASASMESDGQRDGDADEDEGPSAGGALPPTVSKRTTNGRPTYIGNPPEDAPAKPKTASPGTTTTMAQTLQSGLQTQPPPPKKKVQIRSSPTDMESRPTPTANHTQPPPLHVTAAAAAHASAVVAAAHKQPEKRDEEKERAGQCGGAPGQRDASPQVQPPANATMIVTYVDDAKHTQAARKTSAFHHGVFGHSGAASRQKANVATGLHPAAPPPPPPSDPVEMAYTELSCGRSSVSPSALPPLDFSGLPQAAGTIGTDTQQKGTPRGAVVERMKRQGTGAYLSPRHGPVTFASNPDSTVNANSSAQQKSSATVRRGSGGGKAKKASANPNNQNSNGSFADTPRSTRSGVVVRSHTGTPRQSGDTPRSLEGDARRQRALQPQPQQRSAAWNETYGVYVTHPNKLRKLPSYSATVNNPNNANHSNGARWEVRDTAPASAFQRRPSNAAGLPTTPRTFRLANDDTDQNRNSGDSNNSTNNFRRVATNVDWLLMQKKGVHAANEAAATTNGAMTARALGHADPYTRLNTAFAVAGGTAATMPVFGRSHTATAALGQSSAAAAAAFARTTSLNGWQARYDDGNTDAAVHAGHIHSSAFGRLASSRTKLAANNVQGQLHSSRRPHADSAVTGFAPSVSFQRMASRYEDFNPKLASEAFARTASRHHAPPPQPLQRTASAFGRRQSAYQHPFSLHSDHEQQQQQYAAYAEADGGEEQRLRSGRRFCRRASASATLTARTARTGGDGYVWPSTSSRGAENKENTPRGARTARGSGSRNQQRRAGGKAKGMGVFERLTSQYYGEGSTDARVKRDRPHRDGQPTSTTTPRPLRQQATNTTTTAASYQRLKSGNRKLSATTTTAGATATAAAPEVAATGSGRLFGRTHSANAGMAVASGYGSSVRRRRLGGNEIFDVEANSARRMHTQTHDVAA